MRHRGRQRQYTTPQQAAEIVSLRLAGMTYSKICAAVDVSHGAISRVLDRAGLVSHTAPARPKRPASSLARAGVTFVRKLNNYVGSADATYVDIALPRVTFLELAA